MNSTTTNESPPPGNLFDEFEEAFQRCLAPLTKEDPLNGLNLEELKTNAESNSERFLELAHRLDAAFLQKRFLLSTQKPELLIMEENNEMKLERARKDELIKKQNEKMSEWQNTLINLISRVGSAPSGPAAGAKTPTQGPPIPNHPQSTSQSQIGGLTPPQSMVAPGASPGSGPTMGHNMNLSPHNVGSNMPLGHQNMLTTPGSVPMGPMSQSNFHQINMGNSPMHMPMGLSPQHMGQGSMGISSTSSNIGPGMNVSQSGNMVSNIGNMGPSSQGNTMNSGLGMQQGFMFPPGSGPNPMGGQGGLQGPLASLEKTTTNIGMPENKR